LEPIDGLGVAVEKAFQVRFKLFQVSFGYGWEPDSCEKAAKKFPAMGAITRPILGCSLFTLAGLGMSSRVVVLRFSAPRQRGGGQCLCVQPLEPEAGDDVARQEVEPPGGSRSGQTCICESVAAEARLPATSFDAQKRDARSQLGRLTGFGS